MDRIKLLALANENYPEVEDEEARLFCLLTDVTRAYIETIEHEQPFAETLSAALEAVEDNLLHTD